MRTFQRISRLIRPAYAVPVLSALAILGLLWVALGCQPEDRMPESAITASPASPLADVPVPGGFKFLSEKSSTRMAGGYRFVEHMYAGDVSVRSVSNWYRRNMLTLGWKLTEERFQNGRQRFYYDKGNETCYLSVYDNWGTKIFIRISPKGAKPPEVGPASSP